MRASERQVGGDYYSSLPIQPVKYIRENGLGWYEGNIVKYITRYKQKGQEKDIRKVIHYAELILEEYDEQRTNNATASDSDTDSTGSVSAFRTIRNDDRGLPDPDTEGPRLPGI